MISFTNSFSGCICKVIWSSWIHTYAYMLCVYVYMYAWPHVLRQNIMIVRAYDCSEVETIFTSGWIGGRVCDRKVPGTTSARTCPQFIFSYGENPEDWATLLHGVFQGLSLLSPMVPPFPRVLPLCWGLGFERGKQLTREALSQIALRPDLINTHRKGGSTAWWGLKCGVLRFEGLLWRKTGRESSAL